MNPLVEICSQLYPNKCCEDVLLKFKIEEQCLMSVIVKTLGYGIILGSTMVKLPQMLKLGVAKSGAGISLLSVVLELLALTFSSAYAVAKGFPFSAWGESFFLMVMTSIVGCMIVYYDRSVFKAIAFLGLYNSVAYFLISGYVPLRTLYTLQVLNLPLNISSKLVQAYLNYYNGHTGNLSAITIILVFLGCVARIFTSIKETGDRIIIISYIFSATVNGFLVFQMLYYWKRTNQFINRNLAKKVQ